MIEKIWLVTQESMVDGALMFNVTPCACKETAMQVMRDEEQTILNESPKYKDALPYFEGKISEEEMDDFCYEIDESEYGFYIRNLCDDYYENIRIEEKNIQY